jgi:hypothetical protein
MAASPSPRHSHRPATGHRINGDSTVTLRRPAASHRINGVFTVIRPLARAAAQREIHRINGY